MNKQAKFLLLPLLTTIFLFNAAPVLGIDIIVEPSITNNIGYWLSNSIVSTVLLILGIAGIVIEVATVGSFGIFGVVGVSSFILYFIGNIWAGSLGAGAIALFLVGVVLLILEIFVIPGFGVAGSAGIVAIMISLIFAAPNPSSAAVSLIIALIVSIGIILFTLKNKKTRKIWGKLILFTKQQNEEGYVSGDASLSALTGKTGKAQSTLRPAGTAEIEGKKIDVVTQGEFITAGSAIEVVLVEGSRVVVREQRGTTEQ